ncbi:CBM43-containing protein [Zostera marina]|uniref:CBM43-containing protein n=1 Tax=Zostera marina TaxID=29655 RepID=A0A0K9PPR4_ZOSMR|nr:CBM43-containing protein [Zostera marina]
MKTPLLICIAILCSFVVHSDSHSSSFSPQSQPQPQPVYCVYPPPLPLITPHPPPPPLLLRMSPPPPQYTFGPPIFQPPVVYPPPSVPPPPSSSNYQLWCVVKPSVPDPIIQEAMNYACGSGADCDSIQPNGSCYQPDTLIAHASFAFNSYWQRTRVVGGTCDFGGTAMLVTMDPSFDGCQFQRT